jgi:hypothetical protein
MRIFIRVSARSCMSICVCIVCHPAKKEEGSRYRVSDNLWECQTEDSEFIYHT